MAGLVVKLLVKDETKVEEGQPILVLEAMKMEVCTHASCILHLIFTFLIISYAKPVIFILPLKACCKGTMCRMCPWASSYGWSASF